METLLKQRSLSAEQVVEVALPLAEPLDYAHPRRVIHRDLRPANGIRRFLAHWVQADWHLPEASAERSSL